MTSFYSGGYRRIHVVRLNPPLRQKYSIFMRNFQKNQYKMSNNQVQFSNRTLLCKFEPPVKKSWINPFFYYLFYFIYMGQPIGTHMEPGCTPHMDAHIGCIYIASWDHDTILCHRCLNQIYNIFYLFLNSSCPYSLENKRK